MRKPFPRESFLRYGGPTGKESHAPETLSHMIMGSAAVVTNYVGTLPLVLDLHDRNIANYPVLDLQNLSPLHTGSVLSFSPDLQRLE